MSRRRSDSRVERFVIVSNRLPINISRRKGELQLNPSFGGLATGLWPFHKKSKGLWVGWPGTQPRDEEEEYLIERRLRRRYRCVPIFLSQNDLRGFYYGFCNRTIWPLFHYFPQHTTFSAQEWQSYQQVNQLYCDKILSLARPGDIFWIHDYHLSLLPSLIRERVPDAAIGFFMHIPFPSFELFRYMPWREEVLQGLLGSDLIGFHTFDYARHFLSCVLRLLGLDSEFGAITAKGRRVIVDACPMGVDMQRFAELAQDPKVQKETNSLYRRIADRKVIVSVERLDFTKGIPEALRAYDRFLERYPEWHEKVVYIHLCVPSRTQVPSYQKLKREVDELIGRIDGKYGVPGWSPVWYMYRSLPQERLVPLYRCADVALLTPLRDGMNLVAKEYLASRLDATGVLILSARAGASAELGEALIVNPNDIDSIADAIAEALSMSGEEQIERNMRMIERLRRYDVFRWGEDFVDRLHEAKALQKRQAQRCVDPGCQVDLITQYEQSKNRLLLLDYDGSVVPFAKKPSWARPDEKLRENLKCLAGVKENSLVIISGRDRDTLEKWLGDIGASLIAEHGAWIRRASDPEWRMVDEGLSDEWKVRIRPILEMFVDRTPGSLIEEKTFSLSWHFRRAEPAMGSLRAKELVNTLTDLVSGTNLQVLQGSKVVEVKLDSVSKGRAALNWLAGAKRPDFILAIGDDWTDEDMFTVLPETAWTIKVGPASFTKARYFVESVKDVRMMLEKLGGIENA